jgi:hypothetical protein
MRLVVVVSVLAGCASEFGLRDVTADDTDPSTAANSGGSGPWGHLDPGNLPDVYFAVAYSPTQGCGTCDADSIYGYGPTDVHYAVIDLRGQVVWDAPLPYGTTGFAPLDLATAGPGQFTAVLQPWIWDSADVDGFYGASNWEAWRMDAVALTVERTAWERLDAPLTHIERTGADVDLGAPVWLHTGAWADDPDQALFLPSAAACGVEGVGDLRSVPLADPTAAVTSWPSGSVIGDVDGPAWAWGFEPGLDEDGVATALIGVSSGGCYSPDATSRAVIWSPTAGIRWTADLGARTWPLTATYDPLAGGGVLSFTVDDVGASRWRVSEPDGAREGALGTELGNWRPGPLLEHATDTFMDIGTRAEDGFDTIEIRYRGERVWTIDDLRIGMGHVPVHVLDLVVIPPTE